MCDKAIANKLPAASIKNNGKFFKPLIQPKLSINQPNDIYEQEADAMADKVMRMPESSVHNTPFFHPAITPIQRKCAHCEEEEKKMQRKEINKNENAPAETENYISSLSGGKQLDTKTRNFFEPRMGYDFSNVKIHTDTAAAKSAQAVNALAYTTGNNIIFNRNQFNPETESGKKLIGHELTHVVQQNTQTIQRAASDYEITELPQGAASDTSTIFFERGGDVIPASETSKITSLATPFTRNLTLHGFSSEDASAADRLVRVTNRLNAVDTALAGAGHTAARAKIPHPNEGVGDIDYRHRRSVQVLPTPIGLLSAPTTVNPCGAPGAENAAGTELTNCEAKFTEAFSGATPNARAIVNAAERDIVTTPTAAANAVVSRFFSGVPRAVVNANVTAIAAQVRQLPTRHRCHTSCDGGCGRPAYNSGRGLGPTGAMMTICPDFVSAGINFRIETLIHESSHANPVESIEDVAYSNTRLIPFLLPADARRNTDSYVLLMRLVHSPGSMAVGPAAADTLSGMTATGTGSDTEKAQRAIAWLESWLNYGDFDTEILYSTIANSITAGAWVTSGTNEFNIQTMHRLATVFTPDLTDPGPDGTARTGAPTNDDKLRVAAIHDRFDQMYGVVNQHPLTITRLPAGGTEGWGSLVTIPHLTRVVNVLPSFFALSQVNQVKHLVRLMVDARSDISAGFKSKYVDAIDLIHTHRRLGP